MDRRRRINQVFDPVLSVHVAATRVSRLVYLLVANRPLPRTSKGGRSGRTIRTRFERFRWLVARRSQLRGSPGASIYAGLVRVEGGEMKKFLLAGFAGFALFVGNSANAADLAPG